MRSDDKISMVTGEKRLGLAAPVAGIDSGIAGAPAGVAGSGDGRDRSSMTGRPVASAAAPVAVDPALQGVGSDRYMAVGGDGGVKTVEKEDSEGHEGPGASTDTEQPAASESSASESSAVTGKEVAEESAGEPDLYQLRADAVAGTDHQIKTIQDWIEAEGIRPETVEERKKRERTERSKRIIAAVSDGISALSNLYFTSQYAPDMYNHEKGMTKAVGARLEQQKAEREKKRDQYMNFSLKLGDLQNQRAATLRELEAQLEARKIAREKAKRDAEKHNWEKSLQPEKEREQKRKADLAGYKADTAKREADWANEYYGNRAALEGEKINTEKSKQGASKASAANSYASAAAHNRSNQNEFSAWDEHGREHRFRTKDAAEAYAKQHGTWQEEDKTETTTTETKRNPTAQPQQRTSTKTTKVGHAGKPNPTGKSNGKKKNRLGL